MPEDKVKILYESVSKDYDIGTYEEFQLKMDNPQKRKAFYDGVGQEYQLGSYEEFESKLKKKDGTTEGGTSAMEAGVSDLPKAPVESSFQIPTQVETEPISTGVQKPFIVPVSYGNGNLTYDIPVTEDVQGVEMISNAVKRGLSQGRLADELNIGKDIKDIDLEKIAKINKESQAPPSKAYREFNESKTFGEALSKFIQDPIEITSQITGESLTAMAVHGSSRIPLSATTGAVAGTVVPGVGTAAGFSTGVITGMGLTSLNLEYSGSIIQSMQESGVDVTDAEDMKAFVQDEEKLQEAKEKAIKKGVPVAIFDMVSMGIASKIVSKPAKTTLGKLAQKGAAVAAEGVAGGGGEAVGQLASEGEIKDISAIFAEVVGEAASTPVDIAMISFVDKSKKGVSTTKDVVELNKKIPQEQADVMADFTDGAGITNNLKNDIEIVRNAEKKVPEVPQRDDVVAKVAEKDKLKQQQETLDDAFKEDIEQEVKSRDVEIKMLRDNIPSGAIEEANKIRVAKRNPTPKELQSIQDKYGLSGQQISAIRQYLETDVIGSLSKDERQAINDSQVISALNEEGVDAAKTILQEKHLLDPAQTDNVINVLKPEENATQERKITEDGEQQYQQAQEGGIPAETGGSNITEQSGQVQEEVAPIRQLGTGANVYFETEKYRVNDSRDGVMLNIQEEGNLIPVLNPVFESANEAVYVAQKFQDTYPNGVPDALKTEQVVEQFKKDYQNETQETETTETEVLDEESLIEQYARAQEEDAAMESAIQTGDIGTPAENAIARNPFRVNAESYNRFGDPNKVGQNMARTYFTKKGQGNPSNNIDSIAQEITNIEGVEVTPEDIVQYMESYPSGTGTVNSASQNTFYGKNRPVSRAKEIAEQYKELTGKELTDEEVMRVMVPLEERATAIIDKLPEDFEISDNPTIEELNEYDKIIQGIEQGAKSEEISDATAEATKQEEAKQRIADAAQRLASYIGSIAQVTGAEKENLGDILNDLGQALIDAGIATVENVADKIAEYVRGKISANDLAKIQAELDSEIAKVKERSFAKRVLASEEIAPELKEVITEKERYYVPTSNEVSKKEAIAILKKNGIDKSIQMVKDLNNGINFAVRTMMGQLLLKEINIGIKENPDQKEGYLRKAVDLRDWLFDYSTKLGQGVQAFTAFDSITSEEAIFSINLDLNKQNLPPLTPKQEKDIKRLHDKISSAKDGFQVYEATQDLERYMANIKGVNFSDLAMSVWYAHILSGYKTQLLNFFANTAQTGSEIAVSALKNPKAIPSLLAGLYNGYGRGWFEMRNTLKTGYAPFRTNKMQTGPVSVFEAFKFKGGAWNPLNYYKYVSRVMNGVDAFNYMGLREMRAYELAYMGAAKKGKDKPTKQIWSEVYQKMYGTKERRAAAEKQAKEEGLKGINYNRRVYEIMEQTRPDEMVEDAHDFASLGTFNHPTEGRLGMATDAVANFTNKLDFSYKGQSIKPLKFVIPFTNIVSNVANAYLDWTPYGYVRAFRGGIGSKAQKGTKYFREYTPEQRAKEYIKATLATTGFAALAMAFASTKDDDDPPFEITANGTGDYKKNYELQKSGWQRYSVKLGNTWYSYQNTPLAPMFQIVGNMNDAYRYRNKSLKQKSFINKMQYITVNSMQYMTDMTFLVNLSEFMNVFSEENPEAASGYLTRIAEKSAKSFVVPNIYTQVSRDMQSVFDSPMKESDGLMEEIIRDFPIARNGLNDMVNSLGEPVIPDTDRFVSNVESDPIWALIINNEAWVGKPSRYQTIYDSKTREERQMTEEEYYKFAKKRGELIKESIQKNFGRLSVADKKEVQDKIDSYKTAATKRAKEEIFR